MSEFSSYFGSYAHANPVWSEFVEDCETRGKIAWPGYEPEQQESLGLVEVTSENYPKIYSALVKECEFRDISMPACYVDPTGNTDVGWATRENYTVAINESLHDICTEEELRWLIAHEVKHLFQATSDDLDECKLAEIDADKCAVESTSFQTAESFKHKAEAHSFGKIVGAPFKVVNALLPRFLTAHKPFAVHLDRTESGRFKVGFDYGYPTNRQRMRIMREHESALEETACNHS